jgi:hypothetical protein
MEVFSFCFLKPSGWGGYYVMHDKDPDEDSRAPLSTKIPVVGDLYWSAEMSDVQLGKSDDNEATTLGCDTRVCSAVIDTGTSLLVAPQEAVDKVDKALTAWLRNNGSCSDLSMFPQFEFKLNGTTFSLPPEAYIGELPTTENVPSGISTMVSYWAGRAPGTECVPLLMVSDMDTQFGPLWIIGMPFFRKYYSTFKLETFPAGSASLNQPWMPSLNVRSMHFSEADDDCKPSTPVSTKKSLIRQAASSQAAANQLRLDAASLRAPGWVTRGAENSRKVIRI